MRLFCKGFPLHALRAYAIEELPLIEMYSWNTHNGLYFSHYFWSLQIFWVDQENYAIFLDLLWILYVLKSFCLLCE
jgi:hypothetical protein